MTLGFEWNRVAGQARHVGLLVRRVRGPEGPWSGHGPGSRPMAGLDASSRPGGRSAVYWFCLASIGKRCCHAGQQRPEVPGRGASASSGLAGSAFAGPPVAYFVGALAILLASTVVVVCQEPRGDVYRLKNPEEWWLRRVEINEAAPGNGAR